MRQIESFFLGIIAALGALVVQFIADIGFSFYIAPSFRLPFLQTFVSPTLIITGAFIEELFKYLVISKRVEMFSLEKSYIINSLFVGLGFFSVEAGLISMTMKDFPSTSLLEIAIIHIGTAGIIGYIVATRNPKKVSTFVFALLMATLLHGAYNFLVQNRNFFLNYAVYTVLMVIILSNIANFLRISKKLAQD